MEPEVSVTSAHCGYYDMIGWVKATYWVMS